MDVQESRWIPRKKKPACARGESDARKAKNIGSHPPSVNNQLGMCTGHAHHTGHGLWRANHEPRFPLAIACMMRALLCTSCQRRRPTVHGTNPSWHMALLLEDSATRYTIPTCNHQRPPTATLSRILRRVWAGGSSRIPRTVPDELATSRSRRQGHLPLSSPFLDCDNGGANSSEHSVW